MKQSNIPPAPPAGSPQKDLSMRLVHAVHASLPKRPCQTHEDFADLWCDRDAALAALYASLGQLSNTILPARQRAGNASLPVVAYASPDVLRAEMFNSSTQTIRDAVEQATIKQCSLFANALTSGVCNQLLHAGNLGIIAEQHGSKACRVTLPRDDGQRFTCDLVSLQANSHCRGFSSRHRRIHRAARGFLSSIMHIYSGQCVRLVDSKQRVYPPPRTPVSILILGPYVLGFSQNLLPSAPNSRPPATSRLGSFAADIKIAGVITAAAVGTASLIYGITMGSPVWICVAPALVMFGLLCLLYKDLRHASTP